MSYFSLHHRAILFFHPQKEVAPRKDQTSNVNKSMYVKVQLIDEYLKISIQHLV